uniref:Filamentous hemagglutinin n=1 Tax=Lygus hesperus TaxID=30085 RepID=A0A0A9VVS9_LYGHE
MLLLGIATNEVKNIILQVISPYFDDEGGSGGVSSMLANNTVLSTIGVRNGNNTILGEDKDTAKFAKTDVANEQNESSNVARNDEYEEQDFAPHYDHTKSQE